MVTLFRRLSVPANESQMAVALSLSAVAMALMLWAILWQSDVISYQRDVIRWMWSWKFGG
ncbi:MAG: hypothetical protein HY237_11665 [Acidobacteria bacterium]|nr:hypothetical protein [Acidobacteriota bacterium]